MSIPVNHHATRASIEEVYNNICKAFAELDIDAALSFFADHEDMVKISHGHLLRGKEQLAEHWQQRFDKESALRIRIINVEIHEIDDKHVWATADEYISIDEQNHRATVSNIFVLVNSEWKILLDHTTYVESAEN